MASHELYVKDARVWIPHPETVWQGAVITRPFKSGDASVHLRVDVPGSEEVIVPIKGEHELPALRNPVSLIGQSDLTALSYLHEPDVLHNLQVRFCERHNIYTYCGIVLVAINPYAELPLYGQDLINAYRGHSLGELEPHIFAIAEDAYNKLEREKGNLSIIVSGESGAGKTVSAKYAMRYFAAVGGSESETNIERKVLASSPIMEAIGNAKTTRNDNSSRFGKFTKLLFTRNRGNMALKGATMQTYLLEKSRVVFQAPGERNYHIFYQLCAVREKWPALMLDHQDHFRFLNQGKSPNIARVSDAENFADTVNALGTLGFTNDDVKDILTILAGILHLGNVHFQRRESEGGGSDGEESDVLADDLHLGVLCDLLQLKADEMRRWLTIRQIESVNEVVNIPMSCDAAEAARDALSKHVYAKLFQWITSVINRSLASGRKSTASFIGVLDIYGFETFQLNSFEQFCINYANEKLQLQFNQHVFKLEQEEYLREGIVWTMIDFYDNQPCIDMIEDKLGILALLDEECRMPRGSDKSWVDKITEKCAKYRHFGKPKFGGGAFLVKHFSDTVQYESLGFVEKNRDTVSKELVNVIVESRMSLCHKLMTLDDEDHSKEPEERITSGTKVVISAAKVQTLPSKQHKRTVGSQFRDSLTLLISTLHSTTPHYVRCIKPNENKVAFEWEPTKIVQQLRACGVLETVRISAAGFPSRWKYEDFIDRYDLLAKLNQIQEEDLPATARALIMNWIPDEDKCRYGNTQLFFRAGQVAYLEQIRADLRKRYVIIVQSLVKRYIYRKRYQQIRKAVVGIQKYSRGMLARKRVRVVRENKAAVVIQRHVRGWLQRTKYQKTKQTMAKLQARCRGYLVRQKFHVALDNHKAIIVQKFCRGYLARRRFAVKLKRIVTCQAAIRRFLARRRYKRLRAEARTVAGMQKKYMGLENKIISMQQRLDEVRTENKSLKADVGKIPELRARVEFLKKIESEIPPMKVDLQAKVDRIVALEIELTKERDEKMQVLQDRDREQKEWESQRSQIEESVAQLEMTVKSLQAREDELAAQKRPDDFGSDSEVQEVYQRAVQDKEVLESENTNLREEIRRLQLQLHNNNSSLNYSSQSHSLSTNTSSSQNDDDVGYSSAKNTLEVRREEKTPPKNNSTVIILRLRKLLEEEKRSSEHLLGKLERYESLKRPFSHSLSPEDRIRLSELEVEHEKLTKDYESLRQGITRGVETQVLQDHYAALQQELRRRKEESVQLKTVLAEQSQSMRSLNDNASMLDRFQDYTELLEAFQAQKLVNRQLESELTAITEEHNVALREFSRQLDECCLEKNQLHDIMYNEMQKGETEDTQVTTNYLRNELERVMVDYLRCQEELHSLKRMNQIFVERLRDHGLNDSIILDEDVGTMALVNKKPQTYQGICKYRHEDEGKIIQRLVTDYSPQIAITLMPGLPAYIFLMCVRYTDLMNADNHVRTLLSNIMTQSKKFFLSPHAVEARLVVLANIIRIYNLLRQYGGMTEFVNLNTEMQNQQQLKNFDLTEYRRIILTKIVFYYQVFVGQVQDTIKPFIVPALLEHDETTRGKKSARKSLDAEHATPADPAALVQRLRKLNDQFQYYGLGTAYVSQIFHQVFYYMSAVALNNLMLRSDLCTWRTGMKIRYNTGLLKSWAAEVGLPVGVSAKLDVLLEVSGLLQLRKSDSDTDVKSIADMCQLLTSTQILKIIKLYRSDDAEPPITAQFIEMLTIELASRAANDEPSNETFTMDENYCHPVKVNFEYSDVRLEEVELPSALNLSAILTKI